MDVTIDELYACYPVGSHFNPRLMQAQIFKLDKVIVKESKIHGKGVFAKRGIKTREVITFYPADILIFITTGSEGIPQHNAIVGEKYNLNDIVKFDEYKYEITDLLSIIGDPEKDKNMSYVGHLVNDVSNEYEEYEKSRIKTNASFLVVNDLVVVIAMKEIEEGEEILVSYGSDYWKCRNGKN